MTTHQGGTPRQHPNQWQVRMMQLREAIEATPVEGDREALLEEYEIARLNAETVDHDAEVALRLTADAQAETDRLTADGQS